MSSSITADPGYKAAVRQHFNLLKRALEPYDDLLDQLSLSDWFSSRIPSVLSAANTDAKTAKLLSLLAEAPGEVVDEFLQILSENGQEHVANVFTGTGEKRPMSEERFRTIQRNLDQLCRFVDPEGGLLNVLVSGGVFSMSDLDRVRFQPGRTYDDMAHDIVRIWMRKSDCSFAKFIDALHRTHQSHVVTVLMACDGERPLDDCIVTLLATKMEMLVNSIEPKDSNLLEKLVAKGVFSLRDKERVLSRDSPDDMSDMIVKIVLRKSRSSFFRFLRALQESNQQHIIAELGIYVVDGKVEVQVSSGLPDKLQLEKEIRDCLNRDTVLRELLQQNGILAHADIGSILVTFACLSTDALNTLKTMHEVSQLNHLFETSCSQVFPGRSSHFLNVSILPKEFARHRENTESCKLMKQIHRHRMMSARQALSEKVILDGKMLRSFGLCQRQERAIVGKATSAEQFVALLDALMKKPDWAFEQLVKILCEFGHQAAAAELRSPPVTESDEKSSNNLDVCGQLSGLTMDDSAKEFPQTVHLAEDETQAESVGSSSLLGSKPSDGEADGDVFSRAKIYLRSAGYDCLFHEKTSRSLRSSLSMRQKMLSGAVNRLSEMQSGEPEFFWEEPIKSNLLTFLYWCQGEKFKDECRRQHRETLARYPLDMTAATGSLVFAVEDENPEVASMLENVKKRADVESHAKLICEGDVAFALRYLGAKYYMKAIEIYENILKEWRSMQVVELDVASRRAFSGWHFYLAQTYDRMLNRGSRFSLRKRGLPYDEVWRRIRDNLQFILDKGDVVFRGKAMIELIQAFDKCMKITKGKQDICLPENIDPDSFMVEAMAVAPRDPYVLEKCGVYLRKRPQKDTSQIWSQMQKAIEILDKCPTRHVAWHHKGLAYVELWKLGLRDRRSFPMKAQKYSAFKNPPPSAERDRYLINAKECYLKAIELTKGSHCRYYIDLARACVSLGQPDQGGEHYAYAARLSMTDDTVDDHQASELYDQWAKNVLKQIGRHYGDRSDAIAIHRKAIRVAVVTNFARSEATSALLEILRQQRKSGPSDEIMETECNLLHKSIANTSRRAHCILETLRNAYDSASLAEAWKLVEMFHARGRKDDAYAAFLYLTAIFKAERMDIADKSRCGLAVDVVKEVYDGEVGDAAFNSPMRDAYRWFLCMRAKSSPGSEADKEYEVAVLGTSASSADNRAVESVVQLLEFHVGLNVEVCLIAGDVEGDDLSEAKDAVERSEAVVVVDDGDNGAKAAGRRLMTSLLDELYQEPATVVWFVTTYDQEDGGLVGKYAARWPRAVWDVECKQSSAAYSLLKQWLAT